MVVGSAPKDAVLASAQPAAGDKALEWDVPKADACWSEEEQHKKAGGKQGGPRGRAAGLVDEGAGPACAL